MTRRAATSDVVDPAPRGGAKSEAWMPHTSPRRSRAMANATDPLARTVRGMDPQVRCVRRARRARRRGATAWRARVWDVAARVVCANDVAVCVTGDACGVTDCEVSCAM
jgi:hypothetical protein